MKINFDNLIVDSEPTNERKNRNRRQINNARKTLESAKDSLKSFTEDFSELPKFLFDQELAKSQSMVSLLEYKVAVLEQEYTLLRTPIESDLKYRRELLDIFATEIKKFRVRKKILMFHGTPLITALQSIESGELSPSLDRGLGQTSLDIGGQISVTDYRSIQLSLRDYTGINDHFLPMGCIFVVTPENKADERSINSYTMKSLKFHINGSPSPRLKYILASPESLPIIKKQLKKFGYFENLAIDYLSFLKK